LLDRYTVVRLWRTKVTSYMPMTTGEYSRQGPHIQSAASTSYKPCAKCHIIKIKTGKLSQPFRWGICMT